MRRRFIASISECTQKSAGPISEREKRGKKSKGKNIWETKQKRKRFELCKVVFAWMKSMRVNCACNSKWPTATRHCEGYGTNARIIIWSNKPIINWLPNSAIVDCTVNGSPFGSIATEPQEIHTHVRLLWMLFSSLRTQQRNWNTISEQNSKEKENKS